ncbi:MAG: hypothetical protein DBY30_00975 [Verrucomicrobia bacterium]|nr:MAG: hypothetical protein DBY30_00975 [Verrucomicrobiota bacterium]
MRARGERAIFRAAGRHGQTRYSNERRSIKNPRSNAALIHIPPDLKNRKLRPVRNGGNGAEEISRLFAFAPRANR